MKDVSLSIPKVSTQIKAVIQHFQESDEDFILENYAPHPSIKAPVAV